jgi:hypothetical protein
MTVARRWGGGGVEGPGGLGGDNGAAPGVMISGPFPAAHGERSRAVVTTRQVIREVYMYIRYWEPEEREGRLCLLMELCDGGCVATLLRHYGALRWNIVARYICNIMQLRFLLSMRFLFALLRALRWNIVAICQVSERVYVWQRRLRVATLPLH